MLVYEKREILTDEFKKQVFDIIEYLEIKYSEHGHAMYNLNKVRYALNNDTPLADKLVDRLVKFYNNAESGLKIDSLVFYGNFDAKKSKYRIEKGWVMNRYKFIESLPKGCGIYFLYDADMKLEYIGSSSNLNSRIIRSALEKNSMYARYYETPPNYDYLSLEKYIISKCKPKKNILLYLDTPVVEFSPILLSEAIPLGDIYLSEGDWDRNFGLFICEEDLFYDY